MYNCYIRIDCDNVGDKIEFALYNNDPNTAQLISDSIKDGIKWMIKEISGMINGEVLLIGSDDILYATQDNFLDLTKLENLRIDFFKRTNITLSIGIGNSIENALINIKIAKISGKNKIVHKR
ncbi:MAG: mCpol domain-containing protein [Bacteroidota bacterium]